MWQRTMILLLVMLGLGLGAGGCGRDELDRLDSEAVDSRITGESKVKKQSIVQLSVQEVEGSGIILEQTDKQLVVVTAAHVVEGAQEPIKVKAGDTFETESSLVYISENADLAFINIDLSQFSAEQTEGLSAVSTDKQTFDKMQAGDGMLLKGVVSMVETEKSGVLKEAWIYVEDFAQYMMLLQGEIHPGMSGGGVFDERGKLVGMLCGANEDGEVVAVPLSIIWAEYTLFY